MSLVRKHFCTEVMRRAGGSAWPMKYGLNCTMPALVKSSVGSPGGTIGALGMRRWSSAPEEAQERFAQLVWVHNGDYIGARCYGRTVDSFDR